MHTFVGNTSTDANTTTDTCSPTPAPPAGRRQDQSAYWVPTLLRERQGGRAEGRRRLLRLAADRPDPDRAVPAGLPDDRRRRQAAGADPGRLGQPVLLRRRPAARSAAAPTATGRSARRPPPHVPAGLPGLLGRQAPGQPDPQGARRYTYDGTCSGEYPVAIPYVSFLIAYPTSGSRGRLRALLRDGLVDARRRVLRLGQRGARASGSRTASCRRRSATPPATSDDPRGARTPWAPRVRHHVSEQCFPC